jgi:hypothetical protein
VGPLTRDTAVTEHELVEAFPDCELELVTNPQDEGLVEQYWAISRFGEVLYRVEGTDAGVHSVAIVNREIPPPFAVTIGMTHAEATQALGPLSCRSGRDDADWRWDVVVAGNAQTGDWTLDFVGDGASAEALIADPDALARASLVAITWNAWMSELTGNGTGEAPKATEMDR